MEQIVVSEVKYGTFCMVLDMYGVNDYDVMM